MEKIFAMLKTPEDMKVYLAMHYLTSDANTWWVTHRDALLPASSAITLEHPSTPLEEDVRCIFSAYAGNPERSPVLRLIYGVS